MTTRTDRWNATAIPSRVSARAYARWVESADHCWVSTYSVGSHGYAQVGWGEQGRTHMVLAHRASWEHVNGEVPVGMTLDHECKVKRCVNPEHLRLLPNFENARRTDGRDWPLGECVNGHSNEHLREHPRPDRVGLICRECRRIYVARSNWRRRHPGVDLPTRLLLRSELALTA